MNIKINGEPQTLTQPLSVADLLALNKVETPDLVTVQLNGQFVDRSLFGSTHIQENDEVDFLYYLGGGSSQ